MLVSLIRLYVSSQQDFLLWFLRTSLSLGFYGKYLKVLNGWLNFVVNIVWAKKGMSDPCVTQGQPLPQKVV